jgi:S1-C subfamily serine protease
MRFLFFLFPLLLLSAPFHDKKMSESISSSVVKIFTVSVAPDYFRPWQMKSQRASSGTGVLIGGDQILTAAHVVDNGVFITVKKSSDPEKYIAHTKWISHEADLALLEVEDQGFFEDMKALKLGATPHRQDGVAVYGYPEGGNEISITQGIISRIDQTLYVYSNFDLLTLQIDAAINAGNSGGPALNEAGEIVGIAMQKIDDSDNIGYIIPSQIIQHFLDDIEDGKYDGFPDDGLYIQTMENSNLRNHFGMKKRTGVLVIRVVENSSCDGYVKKGDILLEIDGEKVANDLTIPIQGGSRVSANYLVRSDQIGDKLTMKVLRGEKEIVMDIPLEGEKLLIPYVHGKRPEYTIFGGMIFMPLTRNYLQVWGKEWAEKAPVKFVDLIKNKNYPVSEREEVVFLQNTLPDRENVGYDFAHTVVEEVDGRKIRTFSEFVKKIEEGDSGEVRIGLENGSVIVIDRKRAAQANERLLHHYSIPKSSHLEK